MTPRPIGRRGFTLIELLMAVGLSALVFAALASLTGTAARHHLHAVKSAGAQMNAALAFKDVERELSGATFLLSPALRGLEAQTLEGCANAAPAVGGGAPVPIDPARPMSFFAFCQAGGTFYHHALAGCPAAYRCGSSPVTAVGGGGHRVAAAFFRPSREDSVRVSLTAVSGDITAARAGTFSVAVAAGMNP
ncbi:MAG: prepilin-type N-terminal cleavage/methylation domain-containing protein [Elusimicrobia bacterium]|nr:prepilin-type N-terminal cleavage/methylation domain-containing protein [Elusimicrobiota bacterium]